MVIFKSLLTERNDAVILWSPYSPIPTGNFVALIIRLNKMTHSLNIMIRTK